MQNDTAEWSLEDQAAGYSLPARFFHFDRTRRVICRLDSTQSNDYIGHKLLIESIVVGRLLEHEDNMRLIVGCAHDGLDSRSPRPLFAVSIPFPT